MRKQKLYKFKGESLTLTEWAQRLGLSYNTLQMRLLNGWTLARALSTGKLSGRPAKKRRGRPPKAKTAAEIAPTAAPKRKRGRPRKDAVETPQKAAVAPNAAKVARVAESVAKPQPETPPVVEAKGLPVPKRPGAVTNDFLRGMAEGIWLTISSVAMMMAESGEATAAKNLKRVEDMFKGGFAEKFAAAVSDAKKGK